VLSIETTNKVKEFLSYWEQGMAPDYLLETCVLKALCEEDSRHYELTELLSDKAISMLLSEGERHMQHEKRGGLRILISGETFDLTHMAAQYRSLFRQWALRGWVEFTDADSVRRVKNGET